jgi:hypothetical protein
MTIIRSLPRYPTLLAALLCGAVIGCDRKSNSKTPPPATSFSPPVARPAKLPDFGFARPEIETKHEAAGAFVRHFIETCRVGDYEGYRELVSRFEPPEPRERFERLYFGVKAITVESIEPVPGDSERFLVISRVEFDPEAKKYHDRRLAILVVREGNQLRMRRAPAELQPYEPGTRASSQPATSSAPAPAYPWDE